MVPVREALDRDLTFRSSRHAITNVDLTNLIGNEFGCQILGPFSGCIGDRVAPWTEAVIAVNDGIMAGVVSKATEHSRTTVAFETRASPNLTRALDLSPTLDLVDELGAVPLPVVQFLVVGIEWPDQ